MAMRGKESDMRSISESRKAPKSERVPCLLARAPSSTSHRPPSKRSKKLRRFCPAYRAKDPASTKKSPAKVRRLGVAPSLCRRASRGSRSLSKAGFSSLAIWLILFSYGEGGIRTPGGPCRPTAIFETAPFDHSGTSPSTYNYKPIMLLLFFVLALLSITLFEAFLILLLLYMLYKGTRGKVRYSGLLLKPLLVHAFVVLFSTLIYHPSQMGKAIERGLFLLVYPYGEKIRAEKGILYTFNVFLVFCGLLLLPLVVYKAYKTGQPGMLWGGWFEVGAFYSLFAVASLSLTVYTKRWFYIAPFVLFVGVVFFTERRSAMLGLAFALIAFTLIVSRSLSKRLLLGVVLTLSFAFTFSTVLLVQKDARYATLYQVVTGQRSLDEEALNLISSYRWEIAKAGIQVVKRDVQEGNWLALLVGHGINSGYYLEPKSPVGGVYESVFLLSEFIEKGLLGLFAVLWIYWSYARFLFRFKIKESSQVLLMPLLLALGSHLVGAVFTFFWDALLPLYLVFFRVAEKMYE